ncbi:MAG: S-layer homology domain-containing protein, partial [Syntrophomonas sp.]|nr:S-layer homology domain-containing protein [Syntrophomonas sp.]
MIVKAAKLTAVTGGKDFADNAEISPWAMEAITVASYNGIISGYQDNTFKPQGHATRAEAATV